MSNKVADIYAEVSWKFDSIKLREVAKYIGDLNIASIISAGSLTGLGVAIKDLIQETSDLSKNIATIHSTTGIDPTFLQKFENASLELLSTKESADQLITSFSKMKAALNLPGGTLPFGLRMMGFTKKDFEGSLEENMRMVWTRLSQSKPPAGASQAMKEQWQGLLNTMAASFNVSPEQFMAMSNQEFGTKFEMSPFLNTDELSQSIQMQIEWRTATTNLNTEFERLSVSMIPVVNAFSNLLEQLNKWLHNLNDPVKDMTAGGYLKGQGGRHGYISTPEEIHSFNKFWSDFASGQSSIKTKGQLSSEAIAKQSLANKNVTINMSPITVMANDVSGFEKWFEINWKKMMIKTANEFGLGQT